MTPVVLGLLPAVVGADRLSVSNIGQTLRRLQSIMRSTSKSRNRPECCLSMLEAISSESETTNFTCTRSSLMVLPVKDVHETILQKGVKLSPQLNRADVRQFQARRRSRMMSPK
jgi:hypothetical protein